MCRYHRQYTTRSGGSKILLWGAESRGRGVWGEGSAPYAEKIEFLSEIGGFWCILGLLFTFMQKLVRSMGAAAPGPRPP